MFLMGLPVALFPTACERAAAIEARDITREAELQHLPEIEASGLLFLENSDRYLLISDETENRLPMVYLMNRSGHVADALVIQGLEQIDDMEAVCRGENGDIYLGCSQSLTKKGQIPDARKLFLRMEKSGATLRVKNQVFLYELLRDVIERSGDDALNRLIPSYNNRMDINIEGMLFKGGAIFLGLKAPKDADRAIIIKIPDINSVLQKKRIPDKGIVLWRSLKLMDPVWNVSTGISDLCRYQDRLFILSFAGIDKYSPLRKTGLKKIACLWEYDWRQDRLSWIETFRNLQPEGIAVCPDPQSQGALILHIVCDGEGKAASKYFRLVLKGKTLSDGSNNDG